MMVVFDAGKSLAGVIEGCPFYCVNSGRTVVDIRNDGHRAS